MAASKQDLLTDLEIIINQLKNYDCSATCVVLDNSVKNEPKVAEFINSAPDIYSLMQVCGTLGHLIFKLSEKHFSYLMDTLLQCTLLESATIVEESDETM